MVDLISLFSRAPCSNCEIKNHDSAILTPAPHQSQVTSSRYIYAEASNNAVVCTSMMIGRATAVFTK